MNCKDMGKLYYYYDANVEFYEDYYHIDYYCTNGKKKAWAGQIAKRSLSGALNSVKEHIDMPNQPRPLFGRNGRISQWLWFMRQKRN